MSQSDDLLRLPSFARNEALDELIAELATVLGPADEAFSVRGQRPAAPVIFLVGGPRSGSTLTLQALAASGLFAYPTNLMSRFAASPGIGARIQAMLCDERFDYRGELADVGRPISFESDLGKSAGALQPNEFWYFWRRFFPLEQPRKLSESELRQVDVDGFLAGLAAIQAVDGRPLALKAMLVMQDLPFLASLLPNAVFVDVRRHPYFQCQSLLEARRSFSGDVDRWYSVEPDGIDKLSEMDAHHQVAAQVHMLNESLDQQLAAIGQPRTVTMTYTDFCATPNVLIDCIVRAMSSVGHVVTDAPRPLTPFRSRDVVRVDADERDRITRAWFDTTAVDIAGELDIEETTCI